MSKKYTCNQLGVCQNLAECHLPCGGPPGPNRYPFAPGVIEGPDEDDGATFSLIEILLALVCVVAVLAAVGFATGYFSVAWVPAI